VGAGATRTVLQRTVALHRPCPLGVRGESERPKVFGSFCPQKEQLLTFIAILTSTATTTALFSFDYAFNCQNANTHHNNQNNSRTQIHSCKPPLQ
jgi:hypothetical protein